MGLDGALDDRESEAGALDFLLRVVFLDPVEAAEDVRQVGAGDADAVVGDPDADGRRRRSIAADLDLEAGVGVLLEGVLDQVEEHLGPVEAVALEDEVRHPAC